MRRDLSSCRLTRLGVFYFSELEITVVCGEIVLASEVIDSCYDKSTTESFDITTRIDLITSEVIISNLSLSRLIHIKVIWHLSSFKHHSKGVSAVICMMDFTHLNSVVCQIVVDDIRDIIERSIKAENLTIIVQELFLRGYSATSKLFLHKVF